MIRIRAARRGILRTGGKYVAATGAVALVATGLVAVSGAMASLPGSNFEIDGNLTQEAASPAIDWLDSNKLAIAGSSVKVDAATGANDDSYSGGVKEDTVCPSAGTGSIPNNKSDLRTFRVYEEPGTGAHPGYLNIAWSRVNEPSGTTLMDFEFNQSTTGCETGVNKVRTDGDLLIEYLIDQGGARADITLRRWAGAAWAAPEDLDVNSVVCGNGPCAEGTINQTPIAAADSGLTPPADLAERTFGEASIDLRTIFKADKCTSFGSAMLKSRASDAFNSQLKDFIAPVPITLTNCGKVIIRKQTVPDDEPGTFGFTKAFATDPTSTNTFDLSDNGVKEYNNVLFGSGLTVTEDQVETGFSFVSVNCSASTGVTPSVSGATVTFAIDNKNDILDCTYTNQAKAKFTVKKVTNPDTSTAQFAFTPGTGLPAGTFNLGHNATKVFSDLVPGSVTVTETVPATGWDLTGIVCKDAEDNTVTNSGTSPAATVTLAAGDDVTCTFTNRARASIRIFKTDDLDQPLVGATFTATAQGQPDASCSPTLGDHDADSGTGQVAFCDLTNLVPSVEYTVTETTTPDGYETAAAQKATPGPGATVELTFVNNRTFTIVAFVCSNWDNQLYESDVLFGAGTPIPSNDTLPGSVGGADIELTEEQLCELLSTRFGPETAGTYDGSVTID